MKGSGVWWKLLAWSAVVARAGAWEPLGSSCASIPDCGNCTNTYSCHWCEFDQECHARGSIHGCSWGATCGPKPPPKENTTCASHATCSECALSSHLCHWCEHDNACHAVGSPYGCSTGVDCYSNDRCRRSEPEPFHRWVILEAPAVALWTILAMGLFLLASLSACRAFGSHLGGAYDDLASLHAAASSVPPSIVGGTLGGRSNDDHDQHDDDAPFDATSAPEEPPTEAATEAAGDEESPRDPQTPAGNEPTPSSPPASPGVDPDPGAPPVDHPDPIPGADDAGLSTPLLPRSPPSSSSSSVSPHMKSLYRMCSCLHSSAVVLVLAWITIALVFCPKMPVYNVCSDAVAWKHIIENIVTLKLDASFEMLVSVSNPNHITVALDKGTGNFSFNGEPVGTYEIPPALVDSMAVTDLMLIARVTPNRHQALAMAQAYYHGNLHLVADASATLRAPALANFAVDLNLRNIDVYANEMGPRDLCHCPSWDDPMNHTRTDSWSVPEWMELPEER